MLYLPDNASRLPQYNNSNKPTADSLFQNCRYYLWGQPKATNPDTSERLLTHYMGKFIAECPMDTGYRPGSGLDPVIYAGSFYRIYGSSYAYQAAILDQAGRSTAFSFKATEVLWNRKVENFKEVSRLVMAGDFTVSTVEFYTYGAANYAFLQMHHQTKNECNLAFLDGHVTSKLIRPPPNHLTNADYSIVRPEYPN